MTDGKTARVVVVGAGHGGGNMVSFLRQFGHEGPITLIGAESAENHGDVRGFAAGRGNRFESAIDAAWLQRFETKTLIDGGIQAYADE